MSKALSREELAGGLTGRITRQASTLLAAVENCVARARAESQQAASRGLPLRNQAASNQAFLSALGQGRDLAVQPTVYDLEKFAPQCADLIPDNPSVRAAAAHLVGQRYRFTRRVAPGLRRLFGLDTGPVEVAYRQLYSQPLSTIYAPRLSASEQVRWAWARLAGWLENLSPFWTAFALTLTETVGAGILALPIALAEVGPLPGIVLLVVFGLVNLLTLLSVTEAITRNGNMRYGDAFFGRLVNDYLGWPGAWVLGVSLLAINVVALIAYYTGIATTLAAVTGLPSAVWPLLLFLITVYVLRGGALNATIASALVIGAINIALILIMSLLAFPHTQIANLRYVNVPLVGGRIFDPGIFELVFGVVLLAYFGHTSVGNMAKTVLRRDPSGRTLFWGNGAAMLAALVLYIIWLMAVNGAIPADRLAATTGTALIPLAAVVGPHITPFGTLFVILGMGLATLHFSLALFNQVREWLPALPRAQRGVAIVKASSRWRRGLRFALGVTPVALICLLTVWLSLTGRESFSRPLGVIGALAAPLMAGIFPTLLLVASRRKGECAPGVYWRWLGNPVVVGAVYLLFWTSLVIHGLVIWQSPVERTIALAVSLAVGVVTFAILRRGSFRPRLVVEVCDDQRRGGQATFALTANGRPIAAEVQLAYIGRERQLMTAQSSPNPLQATTLHTQTGALPNFSVLKRFTVHFPQTAARELKVWVHRVTPAGDSVGLPVVLTAVRGGDPPAADLPLEDGQTVLPLEQHSYRLEIAF